MGCGVRRRRMFLAAVRAFAEASFLSGFRIRNRTAMNVSELRALLEMNGITPVRQRGQHFLLDESVVRRMVVTADIKAGDRVVEIGPGPGILTEKLLAAGADLVAVELDIKLQNLLKKRFGDKKNFHLLEGDALSFSNAELSSRADTPYKVVANIPYAITSEVLKKFLLEAPFAQSVTVMIQREVADRILAGRRNMSSLAVMVQTYAAVSRVVNVPSGAFFPPPKVASAVIHIVRKNQAELDAFFSGFTEDRFFSIVRTAFAGKRKQLKNTLLAICNDEIALNQAFSAASINPKARPEELGIEDWRRLISALTS
jgi:16S rRNA (adenine1518-N6/adenine1519-N6)-dimethyltransferase